MIEDLHLTSGGMASMRLRRLAPWRSDGETDLCLASSGPWPRTLTPQRQVANLQLTMVLAFSEWWRNSIRERSIAGQHKAREEGRFPGRPTVLTERQKEYVREELAKGVSQRERVRAVVDKTGDISTVLINQPCS